MVKASWPCFGFSGSGGRRRTPASLLVLLLLTAPAWAATDYQVQARLFPQERMVVGTLTMSWTNPTQATAQDLYFHLYFNAWKDPESSFLNSDRIRERKFEGWGPGDWGYHEITSLQVLPDGNFAAADLTPHMEYVQPDDGNPKDQTVMRVPLPQAVPPQQQIRIKMEFKTKVPRTFARTGFRNNYYFLAHWFPKLGVFQEDGTWNCHQFIQTEFFSEFGLYDVELTVPSGWVVGATGRQESFRDNGDGTETHRFVQDRVHEFAWVTSPHFLEFRQRFEHPTLSPVEIRLLLMPDHRGQEERYFKATRAALQYYGEWFGEYPYGHLTVVDPAYGSNSGGMEYPTLFTGGTRWLNPEGSNMPEGVTVHECGHQFWYGLVANNEFEDAWLDEGFNTYSTRRVMLKVFGPDPLIRRYLDGFIPYRLPHMYEAPRTASGLGGALSELKWDIMSRPSWKHGPAPAAVRSPGGRGRIYGPGAYSINAYTKPALMLLTLERYLGWETFRQILSTYFERWRFRHPKPADFFQLAEEIGGQDLSWFWKQTYHSSNIFDYAVDQVDERLGRQRVTLRRWGEGIFPVKVRIRFQDGEERFEEWDGRQRWIRFQYDKASPIQEVVVDPERVLALDVNYTNNSWKREAPATLAAYKWALKWMIWLQNRMEHFAFFH